MPQIAIVEDKSFLLNHWTEELQKEPDIEVCIKASNGMDFLQKLQISPVLPDIVLMDIEMPVLNGIATTSKVKELYPQIQIIMLTVFDEEEKLFQAILAGANGYLLKDSTLEQIVQAIRDVEKGGAQMSAEIAIKALHFLRNSPELKEKLTQTSYILPDDKLSKREIEVLQAIAQGYSYQETAERLFISIDTVRSHLRKIYSKLQAKNKIEAIKKARKRGWI